MIKLIRVAYIYTDRALCYPPKTKKSARESCGLLMMIINFVSTPDSECGIWRYFWELIGVGHDFFGQLFPLAL